MEKLGATTRRIGSAIRTVYFFIFFITTADVLIITWQAFRPNVDQFIHGDFDPVAFTLVIFMFISAISIHGARLYLTMEMLEERYPPFDDYMTELTGWKKDIEFALRLAVVVVVTRKAFGPWHTLSDVLVYLVILYSTLMVWSLTSWLCFKLSFKNSYGWMSLVGLTGALLLYWLEPMMTAGNVTTFSLATMAVTIAIYYLLWSDFSANQQLYLRFVLDKLPHRLRGSELSTGGQQMTPGLLRDLVLIFIGGITIYYCYVSSRATDYQSVRFVTLIFGALLLGLSLASRMTSGGSLFGWLYFIVSGGAIATALLEPKWLWHVDKLDLMFFGAFLAIAQLTAFAVEKTYGKKTEIVVPLQEPLPPDS